MRDYKAILNTTYNHFILILDDSFRINSCNWNCWVKEYDIFRGFWYVSVRSSKKEASMSNFTDNDKGLYVPVPLLTMPQFPPILSIFDSSAIEKWWQGYVFQY